MEKKLLDEVGKISVPMNNLSEENLKKRKNYINIYHETKKKKPNKTTFDTSNFMEKHFDKTDKEPNSFHEFNSCEEINNMDSTVQEETILENLNFLDPKETYKPLYFGNLFDFKFLGSSVTTFEYFVLCISLFTSFNFSNAQIDETLKLISFLLPLSNLAYTSRYKFEKEFQQFEL
jgi:hypothetical protein